MKKIQVTTVPKQANVQVIELNASVIARVVRLQAKLEPIVSGSKCVKTEYNEATQKREEVLDENGNKVYDYSSIDGKFVIEEVVPFFDELCAAFEE